MLAPSEQTNVKKTPSTAYIISVYKVVIITMRGTLILFNDVNFRYLKVMTVKDSKGTGFIGLELGCSTDIYQGMPDYERSRCTNVSSYI